MPRLKATHAGFIDANNLLFTVRGIPVLYYGSEMGFMRGTAEHKGNRNYFGLEGIAAARQHPIHPRLKKIATLRRDTPALQRGLQVNLEFAGHRAAFYRVLQHGEVRQTAAGVAEQGRRAASFAIDQPVQPGTWRNAFDQSVFELAPGTPFTATVAPHDVAVFLYDGALSEPALLARVQQAMARRLGKRP